MTDIESSHPSKLRQVVSIGAGIAAGTAVYGAEGYAVYIAAEMLKAGFQSPETSTVSILCLLGIAVMGLHDLSANRGEATFGFLTSGIRAGMAVHEEITNFPA